MQRKCLQGLVLTSPRGANTRACTALGSRSYFEQYYVGGEVEDWVGEVTRLAEFATSQPQASYAAFTMVDIFYENSAGCLDATAAFRMCLYYRS